MPASEHEAHGRISASIHEPRTNNDTISAVLMADIHYRPVFYRYINGVANIIMKHNYKLLFKNGAPPSAARRRSRAGYLRAGLQHR